MHKRLQCSVSNAFVVGVLLLILSVDVAVPCSAKQLATLARKSTCGGKRVALRHLMPCHSACTQQTQLMNNTAAPLLFVLCLLLACLLVQRRN